MREPGRGAIIAGIGGRCYVPTICRCWRRTSPAPGVPLAPGVRSPMPRSCVAFRLLAAVAVVAAGTLTAAAGASAVPVQARTRPGAIAAAAAAAQHRFGVPAVLLEAICYLEGHLSDHGGAPSSDGGYGCMDLARNRHLDTLGQAARLLGAPVSSVRSNLSLNMAGAAAVLRAD